MKWFVHDIRVTPSSDDASYTTSAAWQGMHHTTSDTTVQICNACIKSFTIKDSPCKIVATGNVGTVVHKGGRGTIDPPAPGTPWVIRFAACLQTMLDCSDRIVGVIDAPPPEHIYEAILATEEARDRLQQIMDSPHKILVLNGEERVMYPAFLAGDTREGAFVTMPRVVRYTNTIWAEFVAEVGWGAVVHTGPGPNRMAVPLSRMLGSYQLCIPGHITIPYPPGCSCPKATAPYIVYSKNIARESTRFSSTRGIAVRPTNEGEVTVTLVLEDPTGTEEEPCMALLRDMLQSDAPAKAGAACFTLARQEQHNPICRRAVQDVISRYRTGECPLPSAIPLMRHASVEKPHSVWH